MREANSTSTRDSGSFRRRAAALLQPKPAVPRFPQLGQLRRNAGRRISLDPRQLLES
jgi:hypothetical protein